MSAEVEVNVVAANKRRRRSSLFVDRRSRIFQDNDDPREKAQNEPVVDSANVNVGEIQNYIFKTKQCYKKWRNYEREIRSKLEAARNAKPLQFDEKTLLEFLNVDDLSFLREAEDFLEKRSELTKEAAMVTSRLEALVEQYEFNQQLLDVVYCDVSKLHQATVAKAVDEHQEMVKRKFGRLQMSSEFPVSNVAPQILDEESDSECF